MFARFFLSFVALAVSGAFGQISLYGPVKAHFKTGDIAPEIEFTKILSAPGNAEWKQSNLEGRLTILFFSLSPSQDPEIITLWNGLVDEFAHKPVQFLLVSGEEESKLLPWLSQHPVKGWVFHDPEGKTGNAYGLEEPSTVFIGTDGKIIGFGLGFPPQSSEINAALEGRITTTRPTPATRKAFLDSHQVFLQAEPFKFPGPDDYKPKFAPSFALHVSPSQGEERGNFGGNDFRVLRGYTLKEAISDMYSVNPIRISLPASLDNDKAYDFSILLPQFEDQEKIKTRMQEGLEDYFHVTGKRESRMADVYVVTTVPGGRRPPSLKQEDGKESGFMSASSVEFETAAGIDDAKAALKPQGIGSIRGVSLDGTVEQFCQTLETTVDRPVVNETNLKGEFEFQVHTSAQAENDFLESLRDHLGLVIAPAQRNIETIVFVPR